MQNFGKIKNVFNNLLAEGIVSKDANSKKLFQKYIKALKESEILKTQFMVYDNIEHKIETDPVSANLYISENIKLLEKFKPADILKENEKLASLVTGTKMVDDYELAPLHESLSKLIFIKRNGQNVDKVIDEIKNVSGHMANNKPKEINESVELPMSMFMNLVVEKYNEKYSTLDESDKKVLRVLLESNFDEKKAQYEELVNECATLVDTKVATADDDSKDKLLKVKTKLMADKAEINEAEIITKILKLVDLKHNLINN
jgi:hypothetical protein